jgi:hypothetical protein
VIVGAPLFGEAEISYANGLRRLVEELGVGACVEYRGHREDIVGGDVSNGYPGTRLTTPEPFGQVVVEGMSAELPVVASRTGGPEQIITDGVDGLLYLPGDVPALARILANLDAEPTLRAQLGLSAARRARDFSPDLMQNRSLARMSRCGNRNPRLTANPPRSNSSGVARPKPLRASLQPSRRE